MSLPRIALIGYGLAGSAFHAPLIASTPGLELAAIVSADPARSAAARELYPGTPIVASTSELWDLGLSAVTIATPNTTHAPLALEAISHGVAAVVDKPMALSSQEAAEVIEAARAANVGLTSFQNRRWDGDFLTVKQLVEDNTLGRIARYESRFERWRPQISPGWRERIPPVQGGGVLFDLGAHLIDQALMLFGPAQDVYAEVDTTRAEAETDDDVFVALTHANGVRSHLFMSATAADLGPRFRVLGTEAAYVTHGLDVQEAALRAGQRPGAGWGEVDPDNWGVLLGQGDPRPYPTVAGNYPAFYTQLALALSTGAAMPVDPADSLTVLRIIEAARVASADRTVVLLPAST